MSYIPQDDKARKDAPLFRGLLGYFPAALFEVAAHSMASDKKHKPDRPEGEPGPFWSRGASVDHADCIPRHLIDAGRRGTRNRRYHLRALAWRALALLQEDCEADGAEPGVSSVFPQPTPPAPEPKRWGVFWFHVPQGSVRSDFCGESYSTREDAQTAIVRLCEQWPTLKHSDYFVKELP